MASKIIMPKLGLTMTEGTVERWCKNEGDAVSAGDTIAEVATDKLTNEIQAECDGVLIKIVAHEGDSVPVKGIIGYIGAQGETVDDASVTTESKKEADAPAKSNEDDNSVLVIGGGPGGYVAAIRAAQLGANVTLIEKGEIGGTCLNRGCMPTKALLHSAEIYELATGSESAGIIGNDVSVDWTKVQANRAGVVSKLTNGVKALVKANKIKLVEGKAVFIGPKTVKVGQKQYSGVKVIIAAGSFPIVPNIPGIRDSKACISSTEALTLSSIPKSMLIIGGGVIGLELGSVYNTFGTKVTVVEAMPKLLPLMDAELTSMVRGQLEAKGIEILTGSKVCSISDKDNGADVEIETDGGKRVLNAEKVLFCVGRGADISELGLETAGIKVENGFIKANGNLETKVPGVYAVGDCTGKLMLAHAAMAMGETAAENAMGASKEFRPEQSPSCAYVGPEFAGVGLTEEAAKGKGLSIKVGRFPTSANGRSLVMNHTDGMIKVIADAKYGEILGVHILAANATDLIEEAALAIKLECTVDELIDTIHCHPTVSEGLREAALAVDKHAIHKGCSVIWCYIDLFGQDDIEKLILVDEAPFLWANPDDTEEEVRRYGGQRIDLWQLCNSFKHGWDEGMSAFDRYFRLGLFPESPEKQYIYDQVAQEQAIDFLPKLMRDHINQDWRDVIQRITVPTMLISGEVSHATTEECCKWMVSVIADCRWSRFPGVGTGSHHMMMNSPEKFNSDIIDFLK